MQFGRHILVLALTAGEEGAHQSLASIISVWLRNAARAFERCCCTEYRWQKARAAAAELPGKRGPISEVGPSPAAARYALMRGRN
jgi:hypothetical protein